MQQGWETSVLGHWTGTLDRHLGLLAARCHLAPCVSSHALWLAAVVLSELWGSDGNQYKPDRLPDFSYAGALPGCVQPQHRPLAPRKPPSAYKLFACPIATAGYAAGEAPLPTLQPTASVRAFGAKGDGVTDDTPALLAAIQSTQKGVIHIPAGR